MIESLDLTKQLSIQTNSKIIYCIVDGVGGISVNGKTELEAANIPNLDRLAKEGSCGLLTPVYPGITVGSGPGHLALFGYDPLKYEIGRGVLETLGANFHLKHGDLAARVNFCTVENGKITDRRAGRISTETCVKLCNKVSAKIKKMGNIEVFFKPVKQHRAMLVFRGRDLGDKIKDTDPQEIGLEPLEALAGDKRSKKSAELVNEFVRQLKEILKDEHPANMILLRGFSEHSPIPQVQDIYRLRPAAIAAYPMYKGVTRLLGMEVLDAGDNFESEVACLKKNYDKYDFFYIHLKDTDSAGEDGNFEKRVEILEKFDKKLKELIDLKPDVLIVTGDHCTPAALKEHSWHPVPVILHAKTCRIDSVTKFTEDECAKGGLGQIKSVHLMPLAMAHAGKLHKFGA